MDRVALIGIALIIIVLYFAMMLLIKTKDKNYQEQEVNLSVASFNPQIKPGNCKVRLEHVGADYDATLAVVNRYRQQVVSKVAVGDIVTENISIYTAEDLLDELKYIGADATIIE